MQDYAWLKLAILAIGGLVVIRIGAGLLFPGKGGDDGAAQTPQSRTSQSQSLAQRVTSKFGGDSELLHTIVTAGVVTWCNPQAIIDGTLMLGAFSATLTVGRPRRSSPAWKPRRHCGSSASPCWCRCSATGSARESSPR